MDGAGATWSWTGLSLVGLVIAFLAAFAVATTLLSRDLIPSPATGLRLDLALFLLLFGAFGMLGVGIAARFAFGRWLAFGARDLVLPAIGVALGIGDELALHEWAEARIGYYDSDFIGWTAGLSFVLVGLSVALFGVVIAPRGASGPPRIAAKLGAALVLFIVLWNVPGLGDGIGPESWPLAVLVGLSGLYAVGIVLPGILRSRC